MTNLAQFNHPISSDPAQLRALQPALERLQGNILRGHRCDHAVHLFLRFKGREDQVKSWIHGFADSVTSAWQQCAPTAQHTPPPASNAPFTNLLLSAHGYRYLQLGVSEFKDVAFKTGMKNAQARLQDPEQTSWCKGYRDEIHAMISFAHAAEKALPTDADIRKDYAAIADICAIERGRVMRDKRFNGRGVEHFGYVDGISQPLFFQEDVNRVQGDTRRWKPEAGPSLVVVPDPHGGDLDFGSYLVFRKLEQNARDFALTVRAYAVTLGVSEDFVGAQAMGRFRDGTPLVLYDQPGHTAPIANDFNFKAEDRYGLKCPFHAHIRKVNPRGDQVGATDRRIARRGMTYGERDIEQERQDGLQPEALPAKDIGLLFMCYQRSITEQFEFLQRQWANEEDHLRRETGSDPVIGQKQEGVQSSQKWRTTWGKTGARPLSFAHVVTLKGGEYFFAPSKNVLKTL